MLSSKVENIIQMQKKKNERDEKTKKDILNTIYKKIKNYAHLGLLECIYKVPNFMFGYPPYITSDITIYIYKQLKSDGFYIIKMNDEYLYISWDVNKLYKKENKNKTEIINNLSAFVNNKKTK